MERDFIVLVLRLNLEKISVRLLTRDYTHDSRIFSSQSRLVKFYIKKELLLRTKNRGTFLYYLILCEFFRKCFKTRIYIVLYISLIISSHNTMIPYT